MNAQSPYEQIKFIHDVIKDRQDKNQPTFFSVKVERYGEITPMVNKEPGLNFYETILQYLTKYDLSAIIIELYNGKAHNIKEPFQDFKLVLKKSTDISLGQLNNVDEIKLSAAETLISPEKHFFTMAEKERQVMLLEFDIKRLQYENEELKRKNKKKKNYIQTLETELGKTEKDKKNSLGNVTLGGIGANAAERFFRSDLGIRILKDVFGAKPDVLMGLLGNTNTNEPPANEIKSTATIIDDTQIPKSEKVPLTENEKIRASIKKFIAEFIDKSNDAVLRYYYELFQFLGNDVETLQSILQQVKNYREKQKKALIEKKMKDDSINKGDSRKQEQFDNDDDNKPTDNDDTS